MWNGPENPFYLNGQDMREQAEKRGIHFDDTTSRESLRPLVVGHMALEYERQYKAAVDAVWHDWIKPDADIEAALKPAE